MATRNRLTKYLIELLAMLRLRA